MSSVKKPGNRSAEKPQGVFYNAQQLYKRWSGLVKLDAIYALMASGELKSIYIQNVRCTHEKHVAHFEEQLFELGKMREFNAGSKHGSFTVTPVVLVEEGNRSKNAPI